MIGFFIFFSANCINHDLINDVDVPGLVKSDEKINVKNCIVFDVPKIRNFIIAHNEPASLERKKRDLFSVDIAACRDLIGPSSSISDFKRLSQTFSHYKIPKPKMIPQTVRAERAEMKNYIQSMVFNNEKRVNKGGLGNCYGSGFKKETFSEFLKMYEEKHHEIVCNSIALCLVADEGRGFLKFNLVYSTTKYQLNAKYSIMLLIAEMKAGLKDLVTFLLDKICSFYKKFKIRMFFSTH